MVGAAESAPQVRWRPRSRGGGSTTGFSPAARISRKTRRSSFPDGTATTTSGAAWRVFEDGRLTNPTTPTAATAMLAAAAPMLQTLTGRRRRPRLISIGFYLVGSFLLVAGFFVGNRGPVRPKGQGPSLFGARFMRWATPLEREESLNESALYVVVGFLLIVLGVAADSRYSLI